MTYPRISEQEYKKALGQFRMQLTGIMNCFRCYGMDADVEGATEEIVVLVEQFGMRVRGKNNMIKVRDTPRRRPTE